VPRRHNYRDQAAIFAIFVCAAPSVRAESHWAFQPISRPVIPETTNTDWVRNPIDAFVWSRLEKQQLAPSAPATDATLIRRVSLDLGGLPPNPAEVDEFVKNSSPHAYHNMIERLLESPHFGERWARHWLDAARYADSGGNEQDPYRAVWKYRDWVVSALNRDLPYDQFIVKQIAGDMLPDATPSDRIATGFHRNNVAHIQPQIVIDRLNATGTGILALTLGCAQCHTHKFDPISHKEYYELYAFFDDMIDETLEFGSPEEKATAKELRDQLAKLRQSLTEYETVLREGQGEWEANLATEQRQSFSEDLQAILKVTASIRTGAQRTQLFNAYRDADEEYRRRQAAIDETTVQLPPLDSTLVVSQRPGAPAPTHIFLRGVFTSKGDEVRPSVPQVFPSLSADDPTRLDFAHWLASPDNPLTARVIVNRIWQRYFGRGIVATENDFGIQAEPPTHPELLDWLASELIRGGWRMKRIHRLILTSSTYRQSSHVRDELVDVDPTNRWLARQSRPRLEAEVIRDQALAVADLLSSEMTGRSVFPFQEAGVMEGRADKSTWSMDSVENRYRRGLYVHFWRLTPHPVMRAFDAPNASESCTRRGHSNTAIQALTLLNDPWFAEAASHLAQRILAVAGATDKHRIEMLFSVCLSRRPTDNEVAILRELLDAQRNARRLRLDHGQATSDAADLASWKSMARTMLNLDEFINRN